MNQSEAGDACAQLLFFKVTAWRLRLTWAFLSNRGVFINADGSLGPEPVCFVGSWSESSRWVGSQFWMQFPWMGQLHLNFPSLTTQLAIIWINKHLKPWLLVCWGYPQTI
jgi:hypothetical protein